MGYKLRRLITCPGLCLPDAPIKSLEASGSRVNEVTPKAGRPTHESGRVGDAGGREGGDRRRLAGWLPKVHGEGLTHGAERELAQKARQSLADPAGARPRADPPSKGGTGGFSINVICSWYRTCHGGNALRGEKS